MKDWEFLIQKEGEPHWLSLPTSTQEIEAGKYRIVAHTRRANVAVDVTVTYQDSSSYHSRQHRYTNSEGLAIIIPWTDLKPGVWRISCCCDILGELLGEFWKKSLQLNVLSATAPSIVLPQKFNLENGEDDIAPEQSSSISPPSADSLLDYFFQNLEPQQIEPPTHEETAESELELILTLVQNTLLREPGVPVAISGQIDILSDDSSWELVEGTLRYQLRDPQTGQVLLDLEQPLSEQSLPLTFSYSLELLPEWKSCLLLGEVILEVPLETVDGSEIRIPVANQSFTITANLEELLKSVQVLEDCRSVAQARLEDSTQLSELRPINLFDPQKSRTNQIRQFRPSSGQILPPKISNATMRKDQPQLPKFVLKSATLAPPQSGAMVVSSQTLEAPSRSEQTQPEARATTAVLANFDGATVSDRAAVDRDFEALKPQERFWSRLNSLTSESASNDSESSSIEEATEEQSRE